MKIAFCLYWQKTRIMILVFRLLWIENPNTLESDGFIWHPELFGWMVKINPELLLHKQTHTPECSYYDNSLMRSSVDYRIWFVNVFPSKWMEYEVRFINYEEISIFLLSSSSNFALNTFRKHGIRIMFSHIEGTHYCSISWMCCDIVTSVSKHSLSLFSWLCVYYPSITFTPFPFL